MDSKQLTQGITDADWARLAEMAKTTPEELRSKYEALLSDHPQNLRETEVTIGKAVKSGDCIKRDFNVSLFKVVGIKGHVEFCGSSSKDWKAKFHVCLELAGSSVWCTDYTLSPTNASICYHPDLTAVKADLCIGIKGSNHCFNISGKACYWAFGWHCKHFDETLFCFG